MEAEIIEDVVEAEESKELEQNETYDHKALEERFEKNEFEYGKKDTERVSLKEKRLSHLSAKRKSGTTKDNDDEEWIYRGAVAVIYHQYSDGRIEVFLEQKRPDYYVEEAREKLALIGGGMKTFEPDTRATQIREISEEVDDENAKNILIKTFKESGEYFKATKDPVKTDVYVIRIDSDEDWKIVTRSRSGHDAGPFKVLSLEELINKYDKGFAFEHGHVAYDFFKKHHPSEVRDIRLSYTHAQQPLVALVKKLGAEAIEFGVDQTKYISNRLANITATTNYSIDIPIQSFAYAETPQPSFKFNQPILSTTKGIQKPLYTH